jgi:predicted heme/steroid binding protein
MNIDRIFKKMIASCFVLMFLSFGSLVMAENGRTYTPEELAKYNGQNGTSAYVAVNGVVYDLTSVPEWVDGRHFCQGAIAGKDLTFIWNITPRSHRNPAFLKRFTVVGKLVAAKPQTSETPSPSVTKSQQPIKPTPSVLDRLTILKPIIWGLIIAIVISFIWLIYRLRMKKFN